MRARNCATIQLVLVSKLCFWTRKVTGPFEKWAPGDNVHYQHQRAKKVMSDSPGLVDFTIGLVNSVLNLPDGQFFEEFKLQKNCQINSAHQNVFAAS